VRIIATTSSSYQISTQIQKTIKAHNSAVIQGLFSLNVPAACEIRSNKSTHIKRITGKYGIVIKNVESVQITTKKMFVLIHKKPILSFF
jgi:hypothetical protein